MNRRSFLISGTSFSLAPVFVYAQQLPDVGVIFVGASWCSWCKSAAPVLASVVQPVGIPVLVASQDGRHIPPFSEVTDAREHPIASQVKALPTTLIFSQSLDGITAEITGYRNARHYARSVSSAISNTLEALG